MEKRSTKELFKNHPASFKLFELVREYIASFDAVTMSAAKTQVSFKSKRQFAWAWLPQLWIKKAPQEGIVVSFSLDRRVRDRRIKESRESYPGRFMHHVVIEKPSQFDAKVKKWLREAYLFSTQAKQKKERNL